MADTSFTETPVGTIISFAGQVNDQATRGKLELKGWLVCDGKSYSAGRDLSTTNENDKYHALYLCIGTTYGTDNRDDPSTFCVPDLRGYFLRGLDTTTAQNIDSGRKLGTLQQDSISKHTHSVNDPGHWHPMYSETWFRKTHNGSGGTSVASKWQGNHSTDNAKTDITIEPQGDAETRPKNIAVNYLIKYR